MPFVSKERTSRTASKRGDEAMTIEFTVLGVPVPKGSTRAFAMMRNGKPFAVTTAANPKTKSWQSEVTVMAQAHAPAEGPWDGPVQLSVNFLMPRPKTLAKKVQHHIKKPDLDKLLRLIKDALKGVIYKDDSQVVEVWASKKYHAVTGVRILATTSSESTHPNPAVSDPNTDS